MTQGRTGRGSQAAFQEEFPGKFHLNLKIQGNYHTIIYSPIESLWPLCMKSIQL